MTLEKLKYMRIATKLINIIAKFIEDGKDCRQTIKVYNNMIDDYELPLPKALWINKNSVDFF